MTTQLRLWPGEGNVSESIPGGESQDSDDEVGMRVDDEVGMRDDEEV